MGRWLFEEARRSTSKPQSCKTAPRTEKQPFFFPGCPLGWIRPTWQRHDHGRPPVRRRDGILFFVMGFGLKPPTWLLAGLFCEIRAVSSIIHITQDRETIRPEAIRPLSDIPQGNEKSMGTYCQKNKKPPTTPNHFFTRNLLPQQVENRRVGRPRAEWTQ